MKNSKESSICLKLNMIDKLDLKKLIPIIKKSSQRKLTVRSKSDLKKIESKKTSAQQKLRVKDK